MRLIKSIIPLLLFASHVSFATNTQFASSDYQNTLIELYTSEGCSSCPPADKWLSEFKHHPKLFTEIVPMAFHVDYWDYIGWQDPFASPKYSNRQKQHFQQRNISQMYTPQLLKNGEEDRTWRYQSHHNLNTEKVGKLSVDVLDDIVYVNFKPHQKQQPLVAHVALLGSGFQSKVTAGENHNKVLKHDFVVLNHAQKRNQGNRWSIPLPTTDKKPKRLALAVWVSTPNSTKPIQVTGAWL